MLSFYVNYTEYNSLGYFNYYIMYRYEIIALYNMYTLVTNKTLLI